MKTKSNTKHILIAFAILILINLIPPGNGITQAGIRALSIFFMGIWLWSFVGVGWTSFLVICLTCFIGIYTPIQVFQNSFGFWVVPFMVASLLISRALQETGFLKRVITWFITRKIVEKKPWVLITMYLLAAMFIGSFMSYLPVAVIFIAMSKALFTELGYEPGDKFPKAMMGALNCVIAVIYGCSPISHALPLMIISSVQADLGITISFGQYLAIGIPVSLVTLILILLFMRFVIKPDVTKLKNFDINAKKKDLVPATKREKITAATFFAVIFIWLYPTIGAKLTPELAAYINSLGFAVPVIIAVIFLSVLNVEGSPVINFNSDVNKIAWPSLFLVAAINLMAGLMTNAELGITAFLSNLFLPVVASVPALVFVMIVILWLLIQTNFMSNHVSMVMVYGIVVPLLGTNPQLGIMPVTIAVMLPMIANYAILTPAASPVASLMLGTEYFDPKTGFKHGIVYLLIGAIALFSVGYPIASAIF